MLTAAAGHRGPAAGASELMSRVVSKVLVESTWCVFGVIGSLMLYGVLQERMMTEPFGEGNKAEVFRYSLFLVLCNRIIAFIAALLLLMARADYTELMPVAPIHSYAAVSVANVAATWCQYEALKYVSFPVQTMGKCARMLPVMMWGIVMMHKQYGLKDFLMAFAITSGCSLFLLTGDVKSKVATSVWDSTVYGLLLMLGYLACDGFTSTLQDKMFKGYQMSTYNQILYTTLCSSMLSTSGLLASQQMPSALGFLSRHPEAMWTIVALSSAATVGALFISYTIKTFGALAFATIMTTRQFLSILVSCVLFFHPLSAGQWAGAVLVFSTLYYQGINIKAKHHDEEACQKVQPLSVNQEASHTCKACDEEAGVMGPEQPTPHQGLEQEGPMREGAALKLATGMQSSE